MTNYMILYNVLSCWYRIRRILLYILISLSFLLGSYILVKTLPAVHSSTADIFACDPASCFLDIYVTNTITPELKCGCQPLLIGDLKFLYLCVKYVYMYTKLLYVATDSLLYCGAARLRNSALTIFGLISCRTQLICAG